ncbi:MAG: dTDP-4-dehydrorhamnose reductase [Bacteroidota bacterium]
MNILVTGFNGQLAIEIYNLSEHFSDETKFFFKTEKELDITEKEETERFLLNNNIDRIINCAAYTNVDNAEDEKEKAFLVNDKAVDNLATIAQSNNIYLMHISTDYVFDGTQYKPYKEDDPTNPVSVYGKSKRAGEVNIMEKQAGMVIRTSWLYSQTGKNFVKSIARLAKERDQLKVVFDQVGNPTYARDLAEVLLKVATTSKNNLPFGIYHFSNEGVCSWYDFAMEIRNILNINCDIQPIESKDFPTKAPRPHYSVLNKEKIKSELHIEIPYWKDSLKEMLKSFNIQNI